MREIKFRGKSLTDGEWAYGNLASDGSRAYIIPFGTDIDDFIEAAERVDPKTVGQCTGLKDRNGIDIYEGDVFTQNECISHGREHVPSVVQWSADQPRFTVRFLDGGPEPALGLLKCYYSRMEVAGNIHDNPELLEL